MNLRTLKLVGVIGGGALVMHRLLSSNNDPVAALATNVSVSRDPYGFILKKEFKMHLRV